MKDPVSRQLGAELDIYKKVFDVFSRMSFGKGGLLRTGITIRACGFAVASTMIACFTLNTFLISNVYDAYKTIKLNEAAVATDTSDYIDRLVRSGLLDPKLQNWLRESIYERPNKQPACEQILALFEGITGSSDDGRAIRAAIMEDVSTGHLSGFISRFFWVTSTFPIGSELFEQLAEADGKVWRRALERSELAEEKSRFIIAYTNTFLAKMQFSLREVNRFNGAVKWLAIFATFLILWSVLGRIYLLCRLQAYWIRHAMIIRRGILSNLRCWFIDTLPVLEIDEHAELIGIRDQLKQQIDNIQLDNFVRRRMKEVRRASDSSVYATYSYAVGLLPSLGFIGTVWGLGGALLQANGLFSVTDRQKTIGHITQELGIAFDTTLIALTASVLTGICIASLRLWEHSLFDQIQNELLKEALCIEP